MVEIEALAVDAGEDLSDFSRYLQQQAIPHRIIESAGNQLVLVTAAPHSIRVRELYNSMRDGKVALRRPVVSDPGARVKRGSDNWQTFLAPLLRYKVIGVGMLLSVLGALLVEFDTRGELVRFFTFHDFSQQLVGFPELTPQQSPDGAQFWRVLTPIFLHHGLLHIAFNMLWFWEFGRRIEGGLGSAYFAAVIVLVGAGSNMLQAIFTPLTGFGGMSGVVYGLLGFCWLWDRVNTRMRFNLPPGIVGFMLVWMVLCIVGVPSALGFGEIANAAHVGGLVIGALLGVLSGWYYRSHPLPRVK